MKLDGSDKVKVFDFAGSGHVIFIDDKNIYYVGDTTRDDYYHYIKAQNGFYKYNKSTKQSTEIFTKGGLKYSDPVYVGGKFLYSSSDDGFCSYDTKTENIKKFNDPNGASVGLPQDVIAYDSTTAYFTDSDNTLYVYNSAEDTIKTVCNIDGDFTRIESKGDGYLVFAGEDSLKKFDLKTLTFVETN